MTGSNETSVTTEGAIATTSVAKIGMYLNTIKPAPHSNKARKRLCRGIGCGLGKTGGRGHKGQKSRAGGFHKVGFEGGQMPLQRRLPKRGFNSMNNWETVYLATIEKLDFANITRQALVNANIVSSLANRIKIINTGELTKVIHVAKCVGVTAKAKELIIKLGGTVEVAQVIKVDKKPKRQQKTDATKTVE